MELNQSKSAQLGNDLKIAIVLPRFNDELGLQLYRNVQNTLILNGVLPKNIDLVRVPGALEIPFATLKLLRTKKFEVIIALGVVIKGETPHFEYVCNECYRGLMDINLLGLIPVVFGVITANNVKQAKDRLKKGKDYANTAIEMAKLNKIY